MSFLDFLSLIVENLSRRKARVALTAVGVIIGTAAVVVLVSLAVGLQRNATEQLGGIGDLTQIQVMPTYGDSGGKPGMVVARAVGGGGGGGGGGGMPQAQTLITDQSLSDLAGLPGVTGVIARDYLQTGAMLSVGSLQGGSQIIGVGTTDLSLLGLKVQTGTLTLARGTIIVGAMVKYNFSDPRQRPGQEPPPPPELFGQQLKLTATKWSQDGTPTNKSQPLTVAGILAESRGEADYSIYMPMDDVTALIAGRWAAASIATVTATTWPSSKLARLTRSSASPTRSRRWAIRPTARNPLCRASTASL